MSRVYVSNISSKAEPEELKELLAESGKIKSYNVKDGSGYIEFDTVEEAEDVIKKYNEYIWF